MIRVDVDCEGSKWNFFPGAVFDIDSGTEVLVDTYPWVWMNANTFDNGHLRKPTAQTFVLASVLCDRGLREHPEEDMWVTVYPAMHPCPVASTLGLYEAMLLHILLLHVYIFRGMAFLHAAVHPIAHGNCHNPLLEELDYTENNHSLKRNILQMVPERESVSFVHLSDSSVQWLC
ncbi:hypothetical protein K474DRAFT_1674168 [Panus rudis PR-1116 ss-1]|nr:hypothetical protein K474DRAFT_1674168 [Panus rudis PR-1116 ss-1]